MNRDEVWDALKEFSREKFNADRARFAAEANAADDGGWHKHSAHHWSRIVDGSRLDYWPTRKKFQYRGNVRRGDVYAIIRRAARPTTPGTGEGE